MAKRKANWRNRCWCCGTWFESIRETATYCSPLCRQRASRRRRKTGYYLQGGEFLPEYRYARRIRL